MKLRKFGNQFPNHHTVVENMQNLVPNCFYQHLFVELQK